MSYNRKFVRAITPNKWFRAGSVEFDTTTDTIRHKLNSLPFLEQYAPNKNERYYFISHENYKKLLLWASDTGICFGKSPRQKFTKNKLSIADICQNIAEGVMSNKELKRL